MAVTRQTLDILDAELSRGFKEDMALDDANHEKVYQRSFAISPKYWDTYSTSLAKIAFAWQWVRYKELNDHLKTTLNRKRLPGIYLFVARPNFLIEGLPSFVFYVGISGEHGSDRPLAARLSDYLRLDSVKKRHAVHRALRQYYEHAWVCYSLLNLPFQTLMDLEEALHGFFVPWAGKRDFPMPMKAARAAWG